MTVDITVEGKLAEIGGTRKTFQKVGQPER